MKRFSVAALLLLLALSVATPAVYGQSLVTGDILGTVTDPSGAVVPNAQVTLSNLDNGTAQTTTTNASGFYRFTLLKPARYQVTVNQTGFAPAKQNVAVAVGNVSTVNLTLSVTGTSQTVEVSAVAPVVNPNPSINTSFAQVEVQNLPSAGGDITNIADTTPGTVVNVLGGYGNFTNNGLPATSNLFTVNGENDMDPYFNINNSGAMNLTLGNNEVQEATVVSNPYGGQYGQLSGAQVTYVTRSGSNAWHGNAQYWWNGRYLNANDWMSNNAGSPRPFSNANQWAGSVGGPIRKNSTFFFVDTEGLTVVLPNIDQVFIPTPAFASAVLANIQSVAPGEANAYQKMFQLQLGAKGAANAAPISNGCGDLTAGTLPGFDPTTQPCTQSFISTPSGHTKQWILAARVDQNVGNSDKAFFRFRMDRGLQATTLDPISPAFNATSNQPAYDGQLQETHLIGANSTNIFTATLSHYQAIFQQNQSLVQQTFPYAMLFSGTVPFTNFNSQYAFPQGRNFTQYQFIDDYTIDKGNHNLKFGANFRRYDISDHNFFWSNPGVYFGYTPNGMTNFVNGLAFQYRQASNQFTNVPVAMWGVGVYGQDEWHVKRNLKLTLALRAERNSNPVCQINCFSNFNGPFSSLPSAQAVASGTSGDVPYTQDIRFNQHQAYPGVDAIDLSPRFGFTWSPASNDKVVFSGGFGIFYDSPPAGLVDDLLANPPVSFAIRVRPSSGVMPFDPGANGGAAIYQASAAGLQSSFANGGTYNSIKAQLAGLGVPFSTPAFTSIVGTVHAPRWQEWNLQLQQQLNRVTALTVNYVGNHGIRILYANGWPNAFDQYGFGILPTSFDRPYGVVTEVKNGATSNYNGLSVSLRRQFSNWFSAHFNYTWSHNLDEVSNGGLFTIGGDTALLQQLNPFNLRQNYGNSDYDIRHNISADYVVTPGFRFGNGFLNQVLGGWTWGGKVFWRTGLPFTITDANVAYGGFGGSVVAQGFGPGATPGQTSECGEANATTSGSAAPCLNSAAFLDVTSSTFTGYTSFPNQRRNQYRGPKFWDVDMSLTKNFKLTEALSMGIGLQAFNVFNHPNFSVPDASLGSPTFGQILTQPSVPTSPYGNFLGFNASPRVAQLTAKLTF